MTSTKNQTSKSTTPDATAFGLAPLVPAERECACSGWAARLPGKADLVGRPKAHRDAAEYDSETDHTFVELECGKTTKALFAPGHDARFKGLAQTAALLGGVLQRNGADAPAETVVAAVAPGLLPFLPTTEQVADHADRLADRAAKAEAKAAKETEVEAA